MKFFPRNEYQCGACGYVVYSRVMAEPGVVRVRCTNRGCGNRGKVFEVKLAAVECEEVLEDAR